MKKIVLFVCIFFLGTSCSPYKQAWKALNSWIGKTENQLYGHWGAPSQVFKMDDGKIIVYQEGSNYHETGNRTTTCKIQFFINNSGTIYNCSFDNCSSIFVKKKARQ